MLVFKDEIIAPVGLGAILMLSSIVVVFVFSTTTGGALVYAQQEENVTITTTNSAEPRFLSIQSAQSGSVSQNNATVYTLELNDVSDKTIFYSDRPNRIVTYVSTSDFVGNWTTGPNSFAIDSPNAALVVDIGTNATSEQDTAIVELFNPVYNEANATLKYDVIPDNATAIDLPDDFLQTTMIIDGAIGPGAVIYHKVSVP